MRLIPGLALGAVLYGGMVSAAAAAFELEPVALSPAPPLELADPEGVVHSLREHAGSVVMVNFWATWCTPCVTEMPHIERVQQALQDRPFVVLAVNAGEGLARVRHFRNRLGLSFPVLLDPDGNAVRAWSVELFPTTFLVDAQGRVRYRLRGEVDWGDEEVEAVIDGLLDEARPGG